MSRRIDLSAPMLELMFLLGMAGVFLTNAAVAVLEPSSFTDLVADSPFGQLVGSGTDWVAPAIAVNDGLLGLALIAVHRAGRLRAPVLAWAGAWLLVVTLIKITTLG